MTCSQFVSCLVCWILGITGEMGFWIPTSVDNSNLNFNILLYAVLNDSQCTDCVLFWFNAAGFSYLTASSVHQRSRFTSAHVGDNVTLDCSYEGGDSGWICWYIQTLGHRPRIIASVFVYSPDVVFYDEFKNNPRFSLVRENQASQLIISHLNVLDSATYYCVLNVAQVVSFADGTTLSVKVPGSTIQTVVHQSASETVHPGGSVTLSCTVQTGSCDGEHRIYWFRTSVESYPGLIYTQGRRYDQCERKPNERTHTCAYNLPMKNLNVSHAGTYYCAVVSCGHVLFGNGTALDFSCE